MGKKYKTNIPSSKFENPFIKVPEKKSFYDKIWDGAKYVGKNFWKVLPLGSLINHENKSSVAREGEGYTPMNIKDLAKDAFHILYAVAGGLVITTLAANEFSYSTDTSSAFKDNSNINQTEQVDTITKSNGLEKSVK